MVKRCSILIISVNPLTKCAIRTIKMGLNCYDVKKFNLPEEPTKKWSFSRNKYGLWYIRDSRNIAGIVGIFFFFMMMIIFFSSLRTKRVLKEPEEKYEWSYVRNLKFSLSQEQRFCDSNVECKNVSFSVMEAVQKEINYMLAKVNTSSLSFVNIQDPDKVIHPGWLDKVNKSINELVIQDTSLTEIKAGSYNGSPFQNLRKLSFKSIGEPRFVKGSFSGLDKLESLSIEGAYCNIMSAEEGTFNDLSSLSSFQIGDCELDPQALKNLTGGITNFPLTNLKILDIRENIIGKLLADSFSKLPNLQSLYLTQSDLNEGLESSVFRGIDPDQIIMDSTHLTTLPQKIFDSFIKNEIQNKLLNVADNKWNCTCDLKWFQDFYISYNYIFQGDPLSCYNDDTITDLKIFDFCNSSETSTDVITTSTPGPTTSPSSHEVTTTTFSTRSITQHPVTVTTSGASVQPQTPTVTPNPDNYDPEQCLAANRSSVSFRTKGNSFSRVIYLGKESVKITFAQIGDEPKYAVTLDKILQDGLVLVFINQAGWTFCLSHLLNEFVLENLDYGQSYVVCILHALQYKVSPRNCQSFTVPKEWGQQSWITNEHEIPFLIILSIFIIFVLIIFLFIMYIYMKKNPDFVYGKENVIVVERKNSKKSTDHEENFYQQHKYPPSLISWSDGYLTPKLYESVEEFSVPCIDQFPSNYLERPRIFPSVRIGKIEENSEVYESVNICPSPYYMNDDFQHRNSDTL